MIMPICNTVAMNHHLCEISSQVAAPRFREGRLCPCRGDPRWCRLAPQPKTRGAQQYHVVGAAAVQPGAQSGRADLALSARVRNYLDDRNDQPRCVALKYGTTIGAAALRNS